MTFQTQPAQTAETYYQPAQQQQRDDGVSDYGQYVSEFDESNGGVASSYPAAMKYYDASGYDQKIVMPPSMDASSYVASYPISGYVQSAGKIYPGQLTGAYNIAGMGSANGYGAAMAYPVAVSVARPGHNGVQMIPRCTSAGSDNTTASTFSGNISDIGVDRIASAAKRPEVRNFIFIAVRFHPLLTS